MNRRSFLRGLVAGAAGLLLPAEVAAEPDRRVWALDSTMLRPRTLYWGFFDKDRPELGVGPCLTPDEPMTVESGWFDTEAGGYDKVFLSGEVFERREFRLLTVDDVYAPWANDPVFMREYRRATRELEAAIHWNRALPWSDFVRRA